MRPQWYVTLEDPDEQEHVWTIYGETTGMFMVAGWKMYEAITPDMGVYVLVDSEQRQIREVMSANWKPTSKADAVTHYQKAAGRYID
jgi:hypothetical protein